MCVHVCCGWQIKAVKTVKLCQILFMLARWIKGDCHQSNESLSSQLIPPWLKCHLTTLLAFPVITSQLVHVSRTHPVLTHQHHQSRSKHRWWRSSSTSRRYSLCLRDVHASGQRHSDVLSLSRCLTRSHTLSHLISCCSCGVQMWASVCDWFLCLRLCEHGHLFFIQLSQVSPAICSWATSIWSGYSRQLMRDTHTLTLTHTLAHTQMRKEEKEKQKWKTIILEFFWKCQEQRQTVQCHIIFERKTE